MLKICKVCQVLKDYNCFHKSDTCIGGYLHLCKDCRNKKIRDKYHSDLTKSRERKNNYYSRNRDRMREGRRGHYNRHKSDYLARYYLRQEHISQATPSWVTKDMLDELKSIYKFSQTLSQSSGIQYHVDHIVPLKGKLVCGLHVPWNLQIIPAEDNLAKGNKHE